MRISNTWSSKNTSRSQALDKNQIQNVQNVNIERFESINEENMEDQIIKMGFRKYDDTTYYETVGTVDGRRYVYMFNNLW